MNITPCPTKTSSPISTPSQMNVWLWILQRAPIFAPRCTSTKVPIRESSPIEQPYRLVNACTMTPVPNSTSFTSRYGASFAGSEVRADTVDDGLDLRLGDAREHRQGEHPRGGRLRDGERAPWIRSAAIRTREVRRLRIVEAGADLTIAQMQRETLRVGGADHVEVPDGITAGRDGGQLEVADARERVRVRRSGSPPLLVPAGEQRQLVREDDRLDRVEARSEADQLVVVLGALAVLTQRLDPSDELRIVGDERARVAEGAEVLPGIEAVRRGEPELARRRTVSRGAVGLARVLDDRDAELAEAAHVRHLPVEVHRHDEPRPRADRRASGFDLHVQIRLRDVDGNRLPAGL